MIKEFNLSEHVGSPVRVYKNLNNGLWSVCHPKSSGRLIGHSSEVLLVKAVCHVSAAGRARVLREQRKNVHAWIEGILTDVDSDEYLHAISYNPYAFEHFFKVKDKSKVESLKFVRLDGKGVFAKF
jgi:hypothetical protein